MVKKYGAVATIDYNSPDSVEQIQKRSSGQLRHAIDCITSEKTMGICMKSICRVGGQYICLERYEPEWITRKAVRVAIVVGAEAAGEGFELEGLYWRGPDPRKLKTTMQMRQEMQRMINAEQIQPHPVHELDGGWSAILRGLQLLREGGVRGIKLVVKIPQETQ
jgi:NADPH:quinone reductase-like Zn-dependent oxidoreductase